MSNLEDWETDGPVEERLVSVRNYNTDGARGSNYLNLDTAERYDRIFHSVQTSADREYVLTFDMRSPLTTLDAGNQLRVRWNGSFVATRIPTQNWQTYSVTLPAAEDGMSLLDFREAYGGEFSAGDGIGPWIDNVRLYEVLPDEAATNEAPSLDAISDRSASVGQALEISVSAADPNNDGLTFQLDRDTPGFPTSATITTVDGQPNNAVVRWTPAESDGTGPFNFVVLVTDDHPTDPKSDQVSFVVTVDANPPLANSFTNDFESEDEECWTQHLEAASGWNTSGCGEFTTIGHSNSIQLVETPEAPIGRSCAKGHVF